jgi:aminopeptidase N
VTFATSPKMSTYLVAMLVGDFACRDGNAEGIPIRVCSTPEKRSQTAFALDAAEAAVKFYNAYFGIKYPFGKLDIIGVPDFAAGAMENAAAITFREVELLADPQRASLQSRKNIAYVVEHEIAHQWFGDLVTMKWWNDIWLNEGFATWMGNKASAAWHPEWHIDLDEESDTQTAVALDALRTTRPIRTNAETPEEINELFDAIAYEKTAAVLRMVEAYVGPDSFQKSVSSYLRKYSYANATGEDFWNEVTRVTGKPVDRVMQSFVDQPGVPVLSIATRCLNPGSQITITQDRFLGAPGARPQQPQTWVIPACYKTDGGQSQCQVIDRHEQMSRAASCGSVFANAQGRGYYLSQYSPEAVSALAHSTSSLQPVERYSLVGDEWWMVRSGRHDIDGMLALTAALAGDETPQITSSLASRMSFVDTYLTTAADRDRFRAWIRERFGPSLAALGLPGSAKDNEDVQSRRASLLSLLGITGNDASVQRQALDLAHKYIADPASVPTTLAATVLQVAAVAGDRTLYDQYIAQLKTLENQPQEYYRYFYALASFRDPALVRRTLDFAMSSEVRSQDTGGVIATLISQPHANAAAWAFTKAQWPAITKKLGTFQGIPEIVQALGAMCSTSDASDVRQFFMQNPVPTSARTLQQSIERIENCAAVKDKQSAPLARWLAGNH